jgi:conjugative transfer signal peptidase TraF
MKVSHHAAVAIVLALILCAVPASYVAGFRYVNTPSVPMGLYKTRPAPKPIQRGEYVCLLASGAHAPNVLRGAVASGLLPTEWKVQSLMKRVAGVWGDVVTYENRVGVLVNGIAIRDSVRLPKDSYGNALPSPRFPVVLEPGQVWLASEHARGFDSRYFGPVEVAALGCVGEPAWTF